VETVWKLINTDWHGGNRYQKICLLQTYALTLKFPPRKLMRFHHTQCSQPSSTKKTPQEGLCGKRAKAARKFVSLITGEITWSCRKWIGNFEGLELLHAQIWSSQSYVYFWAHFLQPFNVFFWPVLFPTYLFLSEEKHCWFPFSCLPNISFKRAINVAFFLRNINH